MRAQSPKKKCHLEIVMGVEGASWREIRTVQARWMVSPWHTVFWPSPSSFPGAALGKEGGGVPGPSGCLRVRPEQARACPPWAERVSPGLERAVQEDKGPPLLFTGLGGSGKAFYKLASQTFVVLSWNIKVLTLFSLKLGQTLAFQNHAILLLVGSMRIPQSKISYQPGMFSFNLF